MYVILFMVKYYIPKYVPQKVVYEPYNENFANFVQYRKYNGIFEIERFSFTS